MFLQPEYSAIFAGKGLVSFAMTTKTDFYE